MSGSTPQRFGCYIGNIDSSVTLDMLKQVFCQCGTILDASLNGRTEDPYRFGFVDFATEDDRSRALKYNGFTLVGRKLRVNVSKGNVGKPEGFGNASATRDTNRSNVAPNQFMPMQQQQQPAMMGNSMGGGGLTPQQQMEAQLLLQLIQQGSVDPQTLTEAQRVLLVASLSGGTVAASGPDTNTVAAAAPSTVMPSPMAGGMMINPMWAGAAVPGGYPGMGMYGNPMMAPGMMGLPYGQPQHQQHRRGPANPPPQEDVMKLREIQRKQFLNVVREETEEYERKRLGKASAKDGARGVEDNSSDSDDGDNGSDDDKPTDGEPHGKKAKMEVADTDA